MGRIVIDVTVVVATHGSSEWQRMGDEALLSALAAGAQALRVHLPIGTVAEARNEGLRQVTTEYVVFLDADDSIEQHYFRAVRPDTDVTATSIKYTYSQASMPVVWQHEHYAWKQHRGYCKGDCLVDGNWIHIGAISRTAAVRAVGGFREYPVYEDWALFLAMQQNGATFGYSFNSIYLAGVRKHNAHRNKSIPLEERNLIHEIIAGELIRAL